MDNNNRGAAIQRRWGAIEEADVRIKNFIERYLALCDEELEKLRQENVKLKQGLSEEKQGLSETKQRNEGKRKSIFLLQQENNDLEEEITDTEERLIASKKKLSASKESLIASRKKILESKGKIIASKNELLANKEMLIQKLEQVEARMSLISSYFKANAENPCTENDEKEKEQVQETSENISLMWQEYQKLTEESNNIKNFLKHIDFDIAKANSRIEKIDLALAELGEEEPKPEEDKAKLEEESTGLEEEQPELDQSQAADNDVTERSQSPRLN
jgi:cell division protein ZapA